MPRKESESVNWNFDFRRFFVLNPALVSFNSGIAISVWVSCSNQWMRPRIQAVLVCLQQEETECTECTKGTTDSSLFLSVTDKMWVPLSHAVYVWLFELCVCVSVCGCVCACVRGWLGTSECGFCCVFSNLNYLPYHCVEVHIVDNTKWNTLKEWAP